MCIALIEYCKSKHEGQVRKSGESYFNHVLEVANISKKIATELNGDGNCLLDVESIFAAGLMHDLIEDTNTDYEDILRMSNIDTASWVQALTEDKKLPFEIRRLIYNETLRVSCLEVRIIKMADIYSNVNGIKGTEDIEWIIRFLDKSKITLNAIKRGLMETANYIDLEILIENKINTFKNMT